MGSTFERRRARVYVAGPISSDPMRGVARATDVSRTMFLDGFAPFVPHWDSLWLLGEGHWEAYLEFDLEFVSVCDAVYRLAGESRGADKEVSVADELGIPVYYESCSQGACPPACNGGYESLLSDMRRLGLTGVKGQVVA
jgi:hypothetical protein